MYIFLKGNIKLIKHDALLILRNGILSFELFCPQLTCAKITHFSIQTEVDIIRDLFLGLHGKDEARTSSFCLNEAETSLVDRTLMTKKGSVGVCGYCVCTCICECVPVMSSALCSILPSLRVLSSSQVDHYFPC